MACSRVLCIRVPSAAAQIRASWTWRRRWRWALTERVERLSEEKGKLEDDMIVLQRQLEQEKIVAAQLRQQLKIDGKEAPGSRSLEERKRDKLVLSPENTAKVLSETIARNRELEEVKKEQEKEIKRLKAQVEVKKAGVERSREEARRRPWRNQHACQEQKQQHDADRHSGTDDASERCDANGCRGENCDTRAE